MHLDFGVEMCALRAVAAVLGAVACLDAQQRAALDFAGVMVLPVDGLRAVYQVVYRQVVDFHQILDSPIVPDSGEFVRLDGHGNHSSRAEH